MGQEIVVPDSFNKGPAQAFAALNAHDDNLSDGIGQSYAVLGYKGKQWSLRYRGQRHNFLRPDDGTPASYIDVIMLGQAKQKSKSFYKKYDAATSDGDRPICSAIDGLNPDPDGDMYGVNTCTLCPRNVWKTDPATGRKGRECSDYKRVAVLLLPTQTKALLGSPLVEPVFLRVPAASLNALAILGDTMTAKGYHYSTYITRISFDPDEAHPKMVFRPIQGLSDQEAPIVLELRSDPTVGRITGGDVALAITHELAPAGTMDTGFSKPSTVAASAPATSQPAPTNGLQTANPTPASASTTAASAQPATTNGAPASPATASPTSKSPQSETQSQVDTGFGGVTLAEATDQPKAAIQTVADTGLPEDSDADLDAQIAGLINIQAA